MMGDRTSTLHYTRWWDLSRYSSVRVVWIVNHLGVWGDYRIVYSTNDYHIVTWISPRHKARPTTWSIDDDHDTTGDGSGARDGRPRAMGVWVCGCLLHAHVVLSSVTTTTTTERDAREGRRRGTGVVIGEPGEARRDG